MNAIITISVSIYYSVKIIVVQDQIYDDTYLHDKH